MQQLQPKNPAMTFDEVSMERSKSFVKSLQELKTLRPQLYSAAEYCEKSYLHSEQKQMVLDNLKDYAVRALVNAVDHLGTVAYKLNDIFEQQVSDVSTLDLQLSCLNQRILTCQIYTDKEGLKQQQLLTVIRRHHKHYILPKSINKKVQFSPEIQTDAKEKHILARPRIHPSGTLASKTLSWHLASETDSTLNGTQNSLMGIKDPKAKGSTLGVFHLLDADAVSLKSSAPRLQKTGGSASGAALQPFGVTQRDYSEVSKQLTAFRSFDNMGRREIVRPPIRSKSMLSAFFSKHKSTKL